MKREYTQWFDRQFFRKKNIASRAAVQMGAVKSQHDHCFKTYRLHASVHTNTKKKTKEKNLNLFFRYFFYKHAGTTSASPNLMNEHNPLLFFCIKPNTTFKKIAIQLLMMVGNSLANWIMGALKKGSYAEIQGFLAAADRKAAA